MSKSGSFLPQSIISKVSATDFELDFGGFVLRFVVIPRILEASQPL